MSYERSTRSSPRRTSGNFPKPVEEGKEYTVDITDTGEREMV